MAWPLVLSVAGCDCDEGRPLGAVDMGGPDGPMALPCPGTDGTSISCDVAQTTCCVLATGAPTCVPIRSCDAQLLLCDDLELPSTANGCIYRAPLNPGRLATHLDIAAAADETLMLSGYSLGASNATYGDLLFGTVSDGEVEWAIIDGYDPNGERPTVSGVFTTPDGWRNGVGPSIGVAESNVGEFNAIAFSPTGVASISYYDRTAGDLKFAFSRDGGTTWSVQTVFTDGDSGRYTSLAYLADGRPAISFLSMVPAADQTQQVRSLVRIAVSNIPLTAEQAPATTDWTVFGAGGTVGPVAEPGSVTECSPSLCGEGLVCRSDGNCGVESMAPDTDCSHEDEMGVTQPGCQESTDCISTPSGGFSCTATVNTAPVQDVPVVNGLYTSLQATATGLALVWYDRTTRGLRGSAFDATASTWRAPFAIDGLTPTNSSDAGYNADLFVDSAGDWHVAYVDGITEELMHAAVTGSTITAANPTVVVGVVDRGTRNPRERSFVGADADIVVTPSGEVRIVYQDSTQLEALVAVRAPGEDEWTLQGGSAGEPLDTEDSTGFFTCQTLIGEISQIATWWVDVTAAPPTNGTRLFTFPVAPAPVP